ncbi:MAG TPA: hypothetical protein PK198_04560 [Saprospiraceae bacterium]|nr:hypothetical protein [Saprospiraceae bacterium]HRJ14594.1 hypothetical protein [Saprospiraceae bacterium]HRK83824.1 hypothetical protein [Saprospiraceae bacterium]
MICIKDETLERLLQEERGNTLAMLLAIQRMRGLKEHITVRTLKGQAGIKSTYLNRYLQRLEKAGYLQRVRTCADPDFGHIDYRLNCEGLSYVPDDAAPESSGADDKATLFLLLQMIHRLIAAITGTLEPRKS